MWIAAFVLLLSVFSQVVSAETTYILCRNKKIVRTIRIESAENGICSTQYTKEGVDKSMVTSKNLSACVSVLDNIRGNLEKANWTCKDISNAQISKDNVVSQ